MLRTRRYRLGLVGWLAPALAACSGPINDLPVRFDPVCIPCQHAACDVPLHAQYLGSGGFALRHGGDEILTGPFFSNPGLLRLAFTRARADEDLVSRFMPDLPNARAILVGHSHYDHLLDVPAVVRLKAPGAVVYANTSGANSIHSEGLRVVAVDKDAWSPGRPVRWLPVDGTHARVLAIESEHAPHFAGITLMCGSYDMPLTRPPAHAIRWLEGRTHAFLIDFLGADGMPAFRIHYQDSASTPPLGFPPSDAELNDPGGRPFTISIVTVASHEQVEGYPQRLFEELRPDFAVLAHWEDFFRPFTRDRESLRSVRATDPVPFLERTREHLGDRFAMPAPLTPITFSRSCP